MSESVDGCHTPCYGGCMTPTQHLANLGRSALALIHEMDGDTTLSERNRQSMIADELRELVRLYRQVVGS